MVNGNHGRYLVSILEDAVQTYSGMRLSLEHWQDVIRHYAGSFKRVYEGFSPRRVVNKARVGVSSIIEQESGLDSSVEIDPSQIESGTLPERVWDLIHTLALTKPTYQKEGIRKNLVEEMRRLNVIFETIEGPRPAVLSRDFLVYVAGASVAQLDPKASIATLITNYKPQDFIEELEFAGYQVVNKPK